MKYAASPKPVLGPCPCKDCGEPVYWARKLTTVLNVVVGSLRWRDWKGHIHQCQPGRQRRYNGRTKSDRYPQDQTTRRGHRHSIIAHETAHHGLARARAKDYNGAVGSSDESNTIADGTRVPATTRDTGVIAFRGSSS